jgi:putative hydrolases of HD superfamily
MGADARLSAEPFVVVSGAAGLARFIHRIGRLKSVARAGWLDRGVPREMAESVADHSYRVAMMAWLASPAVDGLDRDRIIKLALLHDLAEAVTGDLTPHDPAELEGLDAASRREKLNLRQTMSEERRQAKRIAENQAISDLIADLGPEQRAELAALWQELEERTSPEAQFVKQIDILETYLQSREYLADYPGMPVESFKKEVAEVITTPEGVALRDAVGALELEVDKKGS